MGSNFNNLSPSDAHPETMDLLSRAWCNFAVQTLHPEPQEGSLLLMDSPVKQLEGSPRAHPTVRKFHNYFNKYMYVLECIFTFFLNRVIIS